MPRPSLPSTGPSSKPSSSSASFVAEQERLLASDPTNLNPLGSLLDVLASSLSSKRSDSQHACIFALHRAFASLVRQGRVHAVLAGGGAKSGEGSVDRVRRWTRERYDEFVDLLVRLLADETEGNTTRVEAVGVIMSLVRTETELRRSLAPPPPPPTREKAGKEVKDKSWPKETWAKFVKGLLVPRRGDGKEGGKVSADVRDEFVSRYFNYCDDVRFHFLREAGRLASSYAPPETAPPEFATNLLSILECLNTMPTSPSEIDQFWCGRPALARLPDSFVGKRKRQAKEKRKVKEAKRAKMSAKTAGATGVFDDSSDDDGRSSSAEEDGFLDGGSAFAASSIPSRLLPPLLSLPAHRKSFSSAWLALLSLPLPLDQIKRVLAIVHRSILPHLSEPKSMMDFLVDAADRGGVVALLALDGLFTLISKHNLDYPGFFQKLYRLLDRDVLHVRYRPRFLRMLITFLSSTHLPAVLVASFIKRLARLSLFAPPSAIVAITPLVYNLIKAHPTCMQMLHRSSDSPSDDPFDAEEEDPLRTGALASSLWELSSLRSHALSSVATLAKLLEEAFDKPGYDMEDFLDHSYTTMFETEVKRQIRRPPAVSMELSSRAELGLLFPTTAVDDEAGAPDIVSQMWTF